MGNGASTRSKADPTIDPTTKNGIQKAAYAIAEAEVLLFCTGAGWSADSGLATYPGIADIKPYHDMGLEYYDLCQPQWVEKDPSIFYGFWGDSTNVYRNTTPHAGYNIMKKWRDQVVNNSLVKDMFAELVAPYNEKVDTVNEPYLSLTTEPYFNLTSNVDAHFWNPAVGAVFDRNEVTEIHGNVEYWQCSARGWGSDKCQQVPWKLDDNFVFNVDKETMLAQDEENYPRCPTCQKLARPSILMFMDANWDELGEDEKYIKFYDACTKIKEQRPETKFLVIEIGCGLRVPSIRWKSTDFVSEMTSPEQKNVSFIRVNYAKHELPEMCPSSEEANCIYLHGKGLETLQKIDAVLDEVLALQTQYDNLGTNITTNISTSAAATDDSVLETEVED